MASPRGQKTCCLQAYSGFGKASHTEAKAAFYHSSFLDALPGGMNGSAHPAKTGRLNVPPHKKNLCVFCIQQLMASTASKIDVLQGQGDLGLPPSQKLSHLCSFIPLRSV